MTMSILSKLMKCVGLFPSLLGEGAKLDRKKPLPALSQREKEKRL
jgi:hypothetical protein